MKRNDFATMLTVAFTTATLTVAAFWAMPLEAGGDGDTLNPKIARPKLVANGVEVTLSAVSGAEAGGQPVFELAAVNTSDKPAELNLRLAMTASTPSDALSRTVRIPANLWQCDQSIALKAGENKTLKLATRKSVPAGNIISVTLNEIGADVATGPGSSIAPTPMVQPAVAILSFSTGPSAAIVSRVQPKAQVEL